MTLAVARIQKGRIAVVSDTLLIEHEKQLPHQAGVLKTCLLPGDLCVSFANSPELAEAAFTHFRSEYPHGASFANVTKFFEKSSAETGNDYILAFFSTPKLVKVINGKRIPSVAKTVWIGDKFAYERFREYECHARPFPQHGRTINGAFFADEFESSPASDLFSAMRNVILDNEITTVGGFAYTVSTRDNGFRQSAYCDIYYDWPSGVDANFQLDRNDPIDFGASGENFEYSVAQISPGFMGINAAGFYLVKAKKLFFFFGAQFGPAHRCEVFNDVEPTEIKTVLTAACGINLNWLITVASSAPNSVGTHYALRPSEGPKGASFPFLMHENTFPTPTA